MAEYGLSPYDAGVLISEQAKADYFEAAAKGRDAKLVANWVTNDLSARLAADGTGDRREPACPPPHVAELVELIEDGVISSKIAKEVFEHMWDGEGAPAPVVEKHGLVQVTDTGAIEKAIDELIAANPGQGRRRRREAPGHRLVRRPGDEGDRRQGQPGGGQRDPEGEARALTSKGPPGSLRTGPSNAGCSSWRAARG